MANNLVKKEINESHWEELKKQVNNVDNFEIKNPYFNQFNKIIGQYKGSRLSKFITCFGVFLQDKEEMENFLPIDSIRYIEEEIYSRIIKALSKYPNFIRVERGDKNSLGFLFKENFNSDYLFEMAHTVYKIAKAISKISKKEFNVDFYPTISIAMSMMQSAPVANKGIQKIEAQKGDIELRLANSIAHKAYFVENEPGIPMIMDRWIYNKLTDDFRWMVRDSAESNCVVTGPEGQIKINFLKLLPFFDSF
ncbi:hypothetical protein [Spiroplasma endosymbiont of Amphibalanus improvisus]|uniref:hypothetical protein n=1 Tax=Spiroplasma endosymbiont of Amphibalanus improvisus TaxID=3066327 RepID=UPI00313DDB13